MTATATVEHTLRAAPRTLAVGLFQTVKGYWRFAVAVFEFLSDSHGKSIVDDVGSDHRNKAQQNHLYALILKLKIAAGVVVAWLAVWGFGEWADQRWLDGEWIVWWLWPVMTAGGVTVGAHYFGGLESLEDASPEPDALAGSTGGVEYSDVVAGLRAASPVVAKAFKDREASNQRLINDGRRPDTSLIIPKFRLVEQADTGAVVGSIRLPHGATVKKLQNHHDEFASAMGEPTDCVFLRQGKTAADLELMVMPRPLSEMPAPDWAYSDPSVNANILGDGVIAGYEGRMTPVFLNVLVSSALAGQTGAGKSMWFRGITAGALTDPNVNIRWLAFDFSGSHAFSHLRQWCSAYFSGRGDENVRAFVAALKWACDEMERREKWFALLPAGLTNDYKITQAVIDFGNSGEDPRLPVGCFDPVVFVVDEFQVAAQHPECADDVEFFGGQIAREGRKWLVSEHLATQTWEAHIVPGAFLNQLTARTTFKQMSTEATKAILGTGLEGSKPHVDFGVGVFRTRGEHVVDVDGRVPDLCRSFELDRGDVEAVTGRCVHPEPVPVDLGVPIESFVSAVDGVPVESVSVPRSFELDVPAVWPVDENGNRFEIVPAQVLQELMNGAGYKFRGSGAFTKQAKAECFYPASSGTRFVWDGVEFSGTSFRLTEFVGF